MRKPRCHSHDCWVIARDRAIEKSCSTRNDVVPYVDYRANNGTGPRVGAEIRCEEPTTQTDTQKMSARMHSLMTIRDLREQLRSGYQSPPGYDFLSRSGVSCSC